MSGSQVAEFAAAIILLMGFVFIPCLDLVIVPIRWIMAQQLVDSYVRTLSMCETFSESTRIIDADPSLTTQLLQLGGIEVQSLKHRLRITRVLSENYVPQFVEVSGPGQIPLAYLPNGSFAPCEYAIVIDVEMTIAPAILANWEGKHIPGLTESIPVVLHASHEWGNLGQDPQNGKYFINE